MTPTQTPKLARAYLGSSDERADGQRILFRKIYIDDGGGRDDGTRVLLTLFGAEAAVRSVPKRPYTRPRTLARRQQVAGLARAIAGRMGWTLTPAELADITRMETDATLDTTRSR